MLLPPIFFTIIVMPHNYWSEAAHARAVDDKKHHEAEEEKKHQEMGECPRKQGRADTVGLTLAESSTLGVKKALRVCTYCTK